MNFSDDLRARDELVRAQSSGQPDAIAAAAMSNIWPLYSAHFDLLAPAIEGLPASVLERYPVLRVVHRMTPILARTNRPFKPLIYPDDARALSPDDLDVLTLVQMIAFRFSGDVAAAMIYARRLEERILQIHTDSRERTDGPLWFYHQQVGSTHLAAGNSSRALLEFATARQLGKFSLQPDAERVALGRTALAQAIRGSLREAELDLAETLMQPDPTAAHLNSCVATEQTAKAIIAVERMDENVDEALSTLEPYGSIELTWPFALLARTRALLARQQVGEALEVIQLTAEAHPEQHGSFGLDVVNASRIQAHLVAGDVTAARRVADASSKAGLLTKLALTRLLIHENRLNSATRALQAVAADDGVGPVHRSEIYLLTAWVEVLRTDNLDALKAVHVAHLAEDAGLRRLLATMPSLLIERVRGLVADGLAERFEAGISGLGFIEVPRRPTLTEGELRVLHALPNHHTTAAIASAFHVSPNTVKTQLRSLYKKLGCSSRDEAIDVGTRLQILRAELE